DLSYAGAVEAPTVDDIAFIIWDLNKGAVAGLEELNLIPLHKQAVKHAVRALYKRLQQALPEEMKTAVGFDPIVLEHSLCKFSR
ncbi:hypothetical protein DFH07DRAFT_688069, partial [Mycena maculata]